MADETGLDFSDQITSLETKYQQVLFLLWLDGPFFTNLKAYLFLIGH